MLFPITTGPAPPSPLHPSSVLRSEVLRLKNASPPPCRFQAERGTRPGGTKWHKVGSLESMANPIYSVLGFYRLGQIPRIHVSSYTSKTWSF